MTSNKNKLWQPFMIVGYTIVLLFILSFFKLPVGFFNNSERLDILSDIKKSPILTKQVVIEKKYSVVIVQPRKIQHSSPTMATRKKMQLVLFIKSWTVQRHGERR